MEVNEAIDTKPEAKKERGVYQEKLVQNYLTEDYYFFWELLAIYFLVVDSNQIID